MARLRVWKRAGIVILFCITVVAEAQTFTSLASFDGTDGSFPESISLVQGHDGNLYGTTSEDGIHQSGSDFGGVVFRVTRRGVITGLYSFCVQVNCTDGQAPWAGLVLATDGSFYGTTAHGGTLNDGTVFRMDPGGELTTLYSFCSQPSCTDGASPFAPLIQAADGSFFGTTTEGGSSESGGTVFKIDAAGVFTTLHTFKKYPDGSNPFPGLLQSEDGNFYGVTSHGGDKSCNGFIGCGTIFKMTRNGALTTLHQFELTDGALPSQLIQASDGNFYGTTEEGGGGLCPSGCGTAFKITPSGVLTTIYTFCSEPSCADGYAPAAGLIQATDGNLYGTTEFGGLGCTGGNCGTVFRITLDGTLTTLHSFDNTDGSAPYGGLVQATNGVLYGVTSTGGENTCALSLCGTVFSVDVGLGPFVAFVRPDGKVGHTGGILGQGFAGTTSVMLNGIPADFTVVSDTFIRATVPVGTTTGYVTVTTPSGTLTSNVPFHVLP